MRKGREGGKKRRNEEEEIGYGVRESGIYIFRNNIPIPPLNDLVNIHNKKPHDASNQDYPHTQNTSTEATPTQNVHTEAPPTHTPPTEAPAPPSHNESQDLPGGKWMQF